MCKSPERKGRKKVTTPPCVAHCPGVAVRSEHHSQRCRLPIHDHQFFTDVGLSLLLIRRAIQKLHYFKMDSSEHSPYVRIGVDAEHDLIGINRESGFLYAKPLFFSKLMGYFNGLNL